MRKMQKLCEIKILVLKNFSHLSCVWNIHVFCYAPNRAAIEKPENFISLLWVRKAKFSQHSDERRQRHCAEKISKERCDVSRWQIYFMAVSIFSSSWFKTSHLFPIPLTTQFQQQQTCREIFLIQFLLFAFSCKRLLIFIVQVCNSRVNRALFSWICKSCEKLYRTRVENVSFFSNAPHCHRQLLVSRRNSNNFRE